ncbi:MAG TPA: DEAD/DEAH box helicase [Fimbriimonadaceae bacterium]|nr:DEAD/DEAH box helicase [Fimbriimonadaceae bacterium]
MQPPLEHTNDFACLNLSPEINRQLDKLGFTIPTPIQMEAIPHIQAGRDLIGIAQTGTGKTLAFGLPMMQKLLGSDEVGLILAPTRELALQVDEEIKKVGGPLGLRSTVLIGGAPMNRQVGDLRRKPNIIVATPGRLKDHLYQRTTNLKRVSFVVLDEADRMLDMGFAPAVKQIMDQVPSVRQTMLFSATMAKEVVELASQYLNEPVRVEVTPQGTPSDLVEQELHVVERDRKPDLLGSVLYESTGTVLVFSRTRHGARKVARNVRDLGISAAELHSDRTLAQRKAALAGFKSGEFRVLVATDIAARGIDVKEIGTVINYDLPDCIEDYVHRIGRTGRAGASGRAVSFAQPEQHRDVRAIEKLIGRELVVLSGDLPATPIKVAKSGQNHRPRKADQQKRPRAPISMEKAPVVEEATPVRTSRPKPVGTPKQFQKRDFKPRWKSNYSKDAAPRQDSRPPQGERTFEERPRWEKRDSSAAKPERTFKERPRWESRDSSAPKTWKPREDSKPGSEKRAPSSRPWSGGPPKKYQSNPTGKKSFESGNGPKAHRPGIGRDFDAKSDRPTFGRPAHKPNASRPQGPRPYKNNGRRSNGR